MVDSISGFARAAIAARRSRFAQRTSDAARLFHGRELYLASVLPIRFIALSIYANAR
jgi:hypothetical protein